MAENSTEQTPAAAALASAAVIAAAAADDPESLHKSSQNLCPPLPFKTRLFVRALSIITDVSRRTDGSINRRLLNFLDRPTPAYPTPSRGISTVDVQVDPTRGLWFRLFIPSSSISRRLPIAVLFHGGGFAFLSPANFAYDAACRRIARKASVIIASVNYRLSPEYKFPKQYEDGIDVLRFINTGGLSGVKPAFSVDISSCFLIGDSAGANIAHHVARIWAREEEKYNHPNQSELKIRGIVSIQPFFGGEEKTRSEERLEGAPLVSNERTEWLWKAFLPEGENRDHPAANVFGPRGQDKLEKNFPAKVVVIVGGFDPLQDRQKRYCEELKKRGIDSKLVEFENAIHAFYVFPELKESGQLVEVIRDFIEQNKNKIEEDA